MNREEYAQGSMFPRYREDWVGRLTYNYDGKYLIESNGAYNGSEKFAPKYRFGFFPSVALGWMLSNESFLKRDWLDKLKLRYSIGKVGNDNFNYARWAYETNWATDGTDGLISGSDFSPTPYTQYKMASIGNPDLQWEESTKQNLGLELAVFKNRINLNVDVYRDDRDKIFMSNSQRKIPGYFGAAAVAANLGKTESKGYEIEVKYQSSPIHPLTYWLTWTFTRATDKVLYAEDPILLSNYLKTAGYAIGQTKSFFQEPGYLNNWDDVYSSLSLSTGNTTKLPGDYSIVDFNGDGQMDDFDKAPYSFPDHPQNTYTFSLGAEYKGFSIMAQFYGVYNVSRIYGWFMYPFTDVFKGVVFENNVNSWRPDNLDATWPGQRLVSKGAEGTRYLVDGSFMRLKNAEIAYTFKGSLIKKLGVSSTRIYLNGNNLLYFSKMMDDREVSAGISNGASYPMYRTVTLGLNVNF
jgi:TonB-linked SusC/RagA family outer membrane protein